jgi:hypothetical protein
MELEEEEEEEDFIMNNSTAPCTFSAPNHLS